jgi:glutamate synthase (NADPH/NADH) small chain
MSIADRGFDEGWIRPAPPLTRTGKRVAIVGSGPSGLAAAQQLNRAGHHVVVFERSDRPGGLLMYGIPDFKLEKSRVWRRIEQMEEEGVEFRCDANVGVNVATAELRDNFDAILLCGGATQPRDLNIPGRELKGVYFAMDFLTQQNKVNQGDVILEQLRLLAGDKDVIVIGGGDTGSDCDGTSNRQGCKNLTQFELLPQPPDVGNYPRAHQRPANTPWPYWPVIMRTSTSHEEGCQREFAIKTEEFYGDQQGRLKGLRTVNVEWVKDEKGGLSMRDVPGSQRHWPCQLALLAMGFVGPEKRGVIDDLGLELDKRGDTWKVKAETNYMTSVPGVFAAGDLRRGQSLVVWAIHEGREAARAVDKYLMSVTHLPSVNAGDFAWK